MTDTVRSTGAQSEVVLAELAQLPIGQVLGRDHLERVARIATLETYPAGSCVFRQGTPARTLRLVLSGRISLTLDVPGAVPMMVGALSRGDLLGWSALRGEDEPAKWTATASASKASRLLCVPRAKLRKLCELDHELDLYLMRHAFDIVTRRLADCRLQLLDVYGANRAAGG
jgi:CRP-like cAMP-binding protein